ncbi:ComEC/Rec2 family competence protein, partial [Geomonas sp.]|uniref:ComEC/Rec2 family competence protein n=1 Tax=Geomonas sp. TaxID=2651584 RepID=UPI002B45BC57
MQERPLLIPLSSLIAGLCAADAWGSTPPDWSVAALLVTTLAACFVTHRLPFLLSLTMLFFVLGGASLKPFLDPEAGMAVYATEQPVKIQGVIDQRPEGLSTGGGRVYVQVERLWLDGDVHDNDEGPSAPTANGTRTRQGHLGRLLVQIDQGRAPFSTGDRVLFASKIRKPRGLGIPGESDYPRRLAYQGVFATAFLKSADEMVLLTSGDGCRHAMDRLALSLGRFVSLQAPGEEGAVLKALLLGDAGDIPKELSDAYARSGVNHILSISGFHVSIIFLCLFQLLFLLARGSEFLTLHLNLRRSLLALALPVVVFYLFLSGAAPATQRSVLMIAALVAAIHVKRELEPVNSLLLAACAILCWAPETLFEVSFQLSFLAIWGLIVIAPLLVPSWHK